MEYTSSGTGKKDIKYAAQKDASAKARRVLLFLGVLLIAVFLISFTLGRYGVPFGDVIRILVSRIIPMDETWDPNMTVAVINIRLPRILAACIVGCSLSAAGTAYQGVFRNPMASPDILGASSGAAFGAALAILLSASSRIITVSAFACSLLAVAAVYLIARRAPGSGSVNLILAGIMIGSLLSAGTSYIKLVADPNDQLPRITYWLMGSLSGIRLPDIPLLLIPSAIGLVPLMLLRWRINVLSLGDDEARTLGVNTHLTRFAVIICSTLVTAASVSVSGMIGWVGLVVPHICRKLIGSDNRYLMPASLLCGAAFLLVVDDIARNLLAVEIPIGILTALVGAPFFIYLISRREKTL